jgi:hypothetical protein
MQRSRAKIPVLSWRPEVACQINEIARSDGNAALSADGETYKAAIYLGIFQISQIDKLPLILRIVA